MAMADKPRWERRSMQGAQLAIGGGVLAVLAAFMTWFRVAGGFGVTGWDLAYERRRPSGNVIAIGEMFQSGFNPFFTGAVTVLFGLLLVAVGVVFFVVPKRPPPTRLRVHPALLVPALFAGGWALLVPLMNMLTLLRAPDPIGLSIGIGLYLTLLGFLAGLVGLLLAAIGGGEPGVVPAGAPTVASQPLASTPAVAVPSSPQPANWYADPLAGHQLRYWDGTSWTSQVSDQGVVSEDPVEGAGSEEGDLTRRSDSAF